MYVVQVIPLKRGVQIDSLSYFSGTPYPVGTLVHIPVRTATIMGLVTHVEAVSTAKTALRAATFSLRRLPEQHSVLTLSNAYLSTARELSQYYAAHEGAILYALLPPEIQRGEIPLPHTHALDVKDSPIPQIVQAEKHERLSTYRSLVRETFAHSSSVLIVVPTSIEAADVYETLAHGIEDRVIRLTSTMQKKELKAAYEALSDFSRSKLIIATPSHSVLERHDIALVIMEQSRSPHYKDRVRPYLDYRDVLRVHARHTGRLLLFGDILVRTEEEWARRTDQYGAYGETPKRIALPGTITIIARNQESQVSGEKEPFALFAPEMIQMIRDNKRAKKHTFIFAARRGLAPVVACQDCGYIFRSPESGAPYSLLRTVKHGVEERWFVCGTSGDRVRAADVCAVCGSWRLRERGIGIQYVHDELKKLLPQIPIVLFDHTTASTYKKACFLRDTFYDKKGGIMLGTAMAIPYLTRAIDTSLIVHMDALLATPTWRLEEENLALLLKLREITHGHVYVQLRAKEPDVLAYARHATVEAFYTDELALRESFQYPPFATFIHLTWQGSPEAVKAIEEEVRTLLEPFHITLYPSPTPVRGGCIMYGLMRIPASTWPHAPLVAALKRLPPSVRMIINPDRIV